MELLILKIGKPRLVEAPAEIVRGGITYKAHEDYLLCQYQANIVQICRHVEEMLPDIGLTGQWSLDIMQDGQDFWLIDMARAEESALNNCINPGVLRHEEVDWLPNLTELLLEENKSIEEKNKSRQTYIFKTKSLGYAG